MAEEKKVQKENKKDEKKVVEKQEKKEQEKKKVDKPSEKKESKPKETKGADKKPAPVEKEGKIITINLSKQTSKKPRWKSSSAVIKVLRSSIKKRTNSEDVKISKALNEHIWKKGIQKPSKKLRVKLVKSGSTVHVDIVK